MHAALTASAAVILSVAIWAPVATAAAATYGGYGDALQETVDYVVVGGGTAGCAVAARLCENLPEATVIVLERAAPRTPALELLTDSVRLTLDAWEEPGVTEEWLSEPGDGFLPAGARRGVLTGRTLGGTSALNAAQWTKPPLASVAEWGFAGMTTSSSACWFKNFKLMEQLRDQHQHYDSMWPYGIIYLHGPAVSCIHQ